MDRRVVILHFWMKQVDDKWGKEDVGDSKGIDGCKDG